MEHPFLGFDFATGDVSSFLPSKMAMCQRSRCKTLVSIPKRYVVRLSRIAYVSMESFRADWRAANCKVAYVPAEILISSANETNMTELGLLLGIDAVRLSKSIQSTPDLLVMWTALSETGFLQVFGSFYFS